jgi:hypothetical protein
MTNLRERSAGLGGRGSGAEVVSTLKYHRNGCALTMELSISIQSPVWRAAEGPFLPGILAGATLTPAHFLPFFPGLHELQGGEVEVGLHTLAGYVSILASITTECRMKATHILLLA